MNIKGNKIKQQFFAGDVDNKSLLNILDIKCIPYLPVISFDLPDAKISK